MSTGKPEVYLMTLKEATKAFGISDTVLRGAVKSGAIPSLRPTRTFLIAPDDVMAWIRAESESRAEADDS